MNQKSTRKNDQKTDLDKNSVYKNGNNRGENRFKRDGAKQEKFVPNFKKKLPTWKQIDAELNELLPKYDEVSPQADSIPP